MLSGPGVVGRPRDAFWVFSVPKANASAAYHSTVSKGQDLFKQLGCYHSSPDGK